MHMVNGDSNFWLPSPAEKVKFQAW